MVRKGHELGSRRPDWRYPSAEWVAQAERKLALSNRFPAWLRGEDKPGDNAERLTFAQMCYDTKRFANAIRLWAEALAADSKLGDDRQAGHRYNAACAAALAAAGAGKDEAQPDEMGKGKLRVQALDWLMAELAASAKCLDGGDPKLRDQVARTLQHWKSDTDLTGIRDREALTKLPEAERNAWQSLWAEVEGLLKRARGGPERRRAERIAIPGSSEGTHNRMRIGGTSPYGPFGTERLASSRWARCHRSGSDS